MFSWAIDFFNFDILIYRWFGGKIGKRPPRNGEEGCFEICQDTWCVLGWV
jgi:hypothetical protein